MYEDQKKCRGQFAFSKCVANSNCLHIEQVCYNFETYAKYQKQALYFRYFFPGMPSVGGSKAAPDDYYLSDDDYSSDDYYRSVNLRRKLCCLKFSKKTTKIFDKFLP